MRMNGEQKSERKQLEEGHERKEGKINGWRRKPGVFFRFFFVAESDVNSIKPLA